MLPNIHLLGIQGSGKGTQSALLVKKYGLSYLASGNLFRERAEVPDELGVSIQQQLTRGRLLDDDLLYHTVADFLKNRTVPVGLLCDGVIRTVTQYEMMMPLWTAHGLTEPFIIHIDLSEDTALRHIKVRDSYKQDPTLHEHHRVFSGKLLRRSDDNPQAIATRFRLYHEMTAPVITAAEEAGACIRINGEQSIDQIHQEICNHLEVKFPSLRCP